VDLHEGLEINDRLRLLRPLAQGGMAQLWVAEHRTLGVEVVVKVLTPEASREATAKWRFMREARVTARIRCPHVAHVLDYDEGTLTEENDAFLVMELLVGEDLGARIEREFWVSLVEARTIVDHVANALTTAHGLGVVHRDVKPENIFLVDGATGMTAKLVDFGIAKDAAEQMLELTLADAVMGTPHYMSPEQMVGARDVDSRCDVWSLAVVAYACLTGSTPFNGSTFGAVCVATHRGIFSPPSHERPGLSAAVDAFFARAFSLAIDARYPTARALCDAFLQATAANTLVEAKRGGPQTRARKAPSPSAEASVPAAGTQLVLDDLDDLPRRHEPSEDNAAQVK
jgi:serine/threonine protein kinase